MVLQCGGCLPWAWSPRKVHAPPPVHAELHQNASGHTGNLPRFNWQALETKSSERAVLCRALASHGFAIIRMPTEMHEAVRQMQQLAFEFFDRPEEERYALGRLRLFKDKVVGYRELGGGTARFLEVHVLAGMGRAIPAPRVPKDLGPVAVRLHRLLQDMARILITWLAEHIAVPPAALLQCIDEASLGNLEDGDCSASVLRLCCYGYAGEEGNSEHKTGKTQVEEVFFDEHTDASYLTLAPVGSEPGLQFRDAAGTGWLDVERDLGSQQDGHFLVFIGDFLEVLTKGKFSAACHRVAAGVGQGHAKHRFSMPFLVRGQPSSRLDTREFLPEEGEGEGKDMDLLPLEGMSYAAMRRFLDLKGRRRFQGQRLLASVKPGEGDNEGQ
mmetsp:Transcript_90646/g.180274  ORF Transcript_90646/g.180274 Transcript_90646/m.180274 type:complete len:385 (+) Transcript_90646:43-1197(+)